MFEMLLKEKILVEQLKVSLKSKCLEMIKMWSKNVLLQWINVLMLLRPTTEEFQLLMADMSQRQQPEAVRCGCLHLLGKQEESGVQFDASKVVQNLLFDFSWIVRKTLADCLPNIRIKDKENVLSELLQDEEREVIQATGNALAEEILRGACSEEWVEKWLDLVKSRKLKAVEVMGYLPKILKKGDVSKHTQLIIDLLNSMTKTEDDRIECCKAMEPLSQVFNYRFKESLYDPFYSPFLEREAKLADSDLKTYLAEALVQLVFAKPELTHA